MKTEENIVDSGKGCAYEIEHAAGMLGNGYPSQGKNRACICLLARGS